MSLALAPYPIARFRSCAEDLFSRQRPPIRSASVCVPARNEASRLPAFFDALLDSVNHAMGERLICEVVIVLDGCTDGSAAIVRDADRTFPCPVRVLQLPRIGTSHAGRARRAAMDGGNQHITGRENGLYPGTCETRNGHALMTTDADTLVDRDWIAANAAALRTTDLVAGYVDWDTETDLPELIAQERYFDGLHRWRRRIDPVDHDARDPHHKHYGASLAIRGDAYSRLGGLPYRPHNEDTALVRAARLAGYRVRQDRAPRVLTSTRRKGRAECGFADAIQKVESMRSNGDGLEVDCPDALTHGYRASARARQAFVDMHATDACADRDLGPPDGLCMGTDIPDAEFRKAWAESSSADACVTRLFEARASGTRARVPKVPLAQAVERLGELMGRERQEKGDT